MSETAGIEVNLDDDNVDEGDSTVEAEIRSGTGYAIVSPEVGTEHSDRQ